MSWLLGGLEPQGGRVIRNRCESGMTDDCDCSFMDFWRLRMQLRRFAAVKVLGTGFEGGNHPLHRFGKNEADHRLQQS